jgi:hypothetical protein
MSRGPGVWQRKILEALKTDDVMYLRDVLPSGYTTSQRLACLRAAHRLADMRRISLSTLWWVGNKDTSGLAIIARPHIRIHYDVAMRLSLKHLGWADAEIDRRRAIQRAHSYPRVVEQLKRVKDMRDAPWYHEILDILGNDTP